MKRLTARQWAAVLVELTRDAKESSVAHKVKSFVQLVRARRATNLLPRVIRAYREMMDAEHGVVRIQTTAARELPAAIEAELKNLGTEVIIDHTIDPHVIGGVKLTMDDVIIDGTVATRLKKLYES